MSMFTDCDHRKQSKTKNQFRFSYKEVWQSNQSKHTLMGNIVWRKWIGNTIQREKQNDGKNILSTFIWSFK